MCLTLATIAITHGVGVADQGDPFVKSFVGGKKSHLIDCPLHRWFLHRKLHDRKRCYISQAVFDAAHFPPEFPRLN